MSHFTSRLTAIVLVTMLSVGAAFAQASSSMPTDSSAAAKATKKTYRGTTTVKEKFYYGYYGVTCDQRYVMPGCLYDPSRDNHTGGGR